MRVEAVVTEGVGRVSWVFQDRGCVLVVNPVADIEVYGKWLSGADRVVVVVTHYDWGVCGGHWELGRRGAEVYLPGEERGIEWCGWHVEFHSCFEGVADVLVVGSRSGRVGWLVGSGLLSYPRPLFYLEGGIGGGRLAEVEKRLGRCVLDLMERYAIHEEARFFPTVLSSGGGVGVEGWGQGIPPRYTDWLEVVKGLVEGEVHGSGVLPTVWRRYRVLWNRGEVEGGVGGGGVVRVDMRSGGHVRETGLFPSIPYVSGRWMWEYLPLVVSSPGVGLEVVVDGGVVREEVVRQLVRFGFGRARVRLVSFEEVAAAEELLPVVVIDVEEFRLDLLFDPYPFYVVDVRPEEWYVEGHIRGAEHLPLSELIGGLGEEGGSGLTGREKIYVYGRDLEEALMGCWWLVRLGGGKVPVLRVVDGSVDAFLEKDLPVYKTVDVSR